MALLTVFLALINLTYLVVMLQSDSDRKPCVNTWKIIVHGNEMFMSNARLNV